ncbi:MAG TPA: iron ABC transporter permease, partial [Chromatiaceae bacterium]|nr:iron ABC transporter permease [Chromatiaceae bacterium]
AMFTTIFATSLGFILAYIHAKYVFPGQEALRILLLTPLLSTPFIGAIGLKKMITSEGLLNMLFVDVLGILPFRIEITGLAAVVLVQTLLFYPIAFLNIYTSIISIDPTLEEQAENMGARGFYLFRTVTLPLSLPGIEAGALLIFILSIEDLGTPLVFRGSNADKLMPPQIFNNMFTPAGTIKGDATALSMILLLISTIVFISIRKYISLRRYAMLSKGGIWRPRRRPLSIPTTIIIYFFSIIVLSVALLPHIGVILLAFAGEWPSGSLLPTYFTLDNFSKLFTEPGVFRSIINSLTYSIIATLLIAILGVSAAYLVSRFKLKVMSILDTLVTLPIAIPGIIIATGFFLVFL